MADLAHYYRRAKSGIAGIDPREAADLGEEWLITGATGAALGLMAASLQGGLDAKIAGQEVPVDGIVSAGLALAGLATHSRELKVASIAAGGSAATRVFTKFFAKGIGAHGDIEDVARQVGYGWGAGSSDHLIEAAKYL